MRNGFLVSVLASLASASMVAAQSEPIVVESPAPMIFYRVWDRDSQPNAARTWVSAEYLNWWMTRGPVGVPLVTTGDPLSLNPGAIGEPGTQVLFGNSGFDFGGFNGGRISIGRWLGDERRVGIEASGFLFEQRSTNFSAASDAAGNPILAVPLQDITGFQGAYLVSDPLFGQTGSIVIASTSRLWGADLNGALNVYDNGRLAIHFLAGFRYNDLAERLRMETTTEFDVGFFFPVIARFTTLDTFNTRNQFYGGQFGARGSYQRGRFCVDLLGQIALGSTRHTLNTGGSFDIALDGVPFPVPLPPGGLLTAPSNLGTFHSSSFSVIPQMQVKVGYDLTPRLRATIGYDAMFWTNVVRPGNQIDRVIGFGLPDDTRPAPQNNRSDLWVHGFTTGLQFRW